MTKRPQQVLLASAAALAFAGSVNAQTAAPAAPESPHSFTGKVGLYSEYEYRGISQTSEKPALQLNLDYAHASGFYVGTFITNIKWLKDTAEVNGFSTKAKIEWDIYAGYKKEIAKDLTLDVGYLRYEYPQSKEFHPKPNTDEVYAGLTYGPFNAKYSYSFNDTFGVPDSKGSDFIEANVAYPIPSFEKLSITGHVGHQRYKGTQIHGFHNGDLSYTVWKLGAVYDFGGGWNAGAYYKGTNADEALYTVKGKDWSKDRLVAFVAYSF